jgi:hypothetical protein
MSCMLNLKVLHLTSVSLLKSALFLEREMLYTIRLFNFYLTLLVSTIGLTIVKNKRGLINSITSSK